MFFFGSQICLESKGAFRPCPRLRDPVLEQQNSLGALGSSCAQRCTAPKLLPMLPVRCIFHGDGTGRNRAAWHMIVVQSQYVASFEMSQYSINKQGA